MAIKVQKDKDLEKIQKDKDFEKISKEKDDKEIIKELKEFKEKDKDQKEFKEKEKEHKEGKEKDKDKEKEKEKEFKEFKEHKEFKEFKEKDQKELEKIIKDKDKDSFEGGLPGQGGDPGPLVNQLMQRIANLENQLATGKAFIRQEERPDVGGAALRGKTPAKKKKGPQKPR